MTRADIFEQYGIGIYHSAARLYNRFLHYPRKSWMMQAFITNIERQQAALKQERENARINK